jgi:hypothetical protein
MQSSSALDDFMETTFRVAGLTFLIGPGILLWQTYVWLRYGYWQPVPVYDAFTFFGVAPPSSTWIGVQQIIDQMLDWPLSIVSFAAAIIFVIAVGALFGLFAVFVEALVHRFRTKGRR